MNDIVKQIEQHQKGDQEVHTRYAVCSGGVLSIGKVFPGTCRVGNRGAVNQFTPSSGARMARYLRSCTADYRVLITLTYPEGFGTVGGQCKEDLRVFCQWYKRQYPAGAGLFWFMEFTQQGRMHFHLYGTDYLDKRTLAKKWAHIVGSEDTNHERAGTRIEQIRSGRHGTIAYANKYAAKQSQKSVPKGFGWCGRFWGVVGQRTRVEASTSVRPRYLCDTAVQSAWNDLVGYVEEQSTAKTVETIVVRGLQRVILVEGDIERRVMELISGVSDAVQRQIDEDIMFLTTEFDDEHREEGFFDHDNPKHISADEINLRCISGDLNIDDIPPDWLEYGCLNKELRHWYATSLYQSS